MNKFKNFFYIFTASSKEIIIIWGIEFGSSFPGIWVPSGEQKQSGRMHSDWLQRGELFGSLSIAGANEFKLW